MKWKTKWSAWLLPVGLLLAAILSVPLLRGFVDPPVALTPVGHIVAVPIGADERVATYLLTQSCVHNSSGLTSGYEVEEDYCIYAGKPHYKLAVSGTRIIGVLYQLWPSEVQAHKTLTLDQCNAFGPTDRVRQNGATDGNVWWQSASLAKTLPTSDFRTPQGVLVPAGTTTEHITVDASTGAYTMCSWYVGQA